MDIDDNKSIPGETDDNQPVTGETDDNQAGPGETDDNSASADEDESDRFFRKLEKENSGYLSVFGDDLRKSGLSESTVRRHLMNADLFLNAFLMYRECLTMKAGVSMVGSFLGDFFIRKCAWSTPGNIKTTAASLKKFYKSMLGHGLIGSDSYSHICDEIKNHMELWQKDCAQFNDPDQEDPFYPV